MKNYVIAAVNKGVIKFDDNPDWADEHWGFWAIYVLNGHHFLARVQTYDDVYDYHGNYIGGDTGDVKKAIEEAIAAEKNMASTPGNRMVKSIQLHAICSGCHRCKIK